MRRALAKRASAASSVLPPDRAPNSARLSRSAARLLRHELLGKRRARRRAVDEHRVEHPGNAGLVGDADSRERRLLPLRIEGAEVDQQRIGACRKGPHLLLRDGHRRHRAGREQHIGGEILRHRIGDAMHPRPALAQALQNIGRDGRQFMVALRSLCGARISPSAGMTRIRFDGLAFASQPDSQRSKNCSLRSPKTPGTP